ncbi:AraC family transcriptional regulator [Zhongshania aliphaticivorans]|uniref:AraC family transcriptional regulator n=1 Tax=Zhongshania aliphaticivorans TaxID=1470434 RepID=UPI0012E63055|nr:AraC family transcriptional regulator [Zhongshania aliphaticivorans]CAA0100768.1 putative HTH-type transcriptional regulator [Zhongshania aliphaticivorans]
MKTSCYLVASDKVIPAWLQPVAILDLCAARGIDTHELLLNTALFASDLPFTGRYISLLQFQQLLRNANRLWPGADFPFQLGHQLLHHGLGPISALVDSYSELPTVLTLLCDYSVLLSPDLAMRLVRPAPNEILIMFRPSAFASVDGLALVAAITTLASIIKRFSGLREARYYFRSSAGEHREHFIAHLNGSCCFSAPFDGVRLLVDEADKESVSISVRSQVAIADCEALLPNASYLSERLQKILASEGGGHSDLSACSVKLGISQATLKRRLREHGLSFQQQLDQYQLELALIELLLKRTSVDDAAARLNFHDSSNFRRAFKRWTGLSPSLMKANFNDLMPPLVK